MKQEIIDRMRAELYNSRWCQEDFVNDLQVIEFNHEPFFWMVHENGTSLLLVDGYSISELYSKNSTRFSLFRDFYSPVVCYFEFYKSRPMTKYFYWDGYTFQRVSSYRDLCEIWAALAKKFQDKAIRQYNEEYGCRDKKLEVKFSSESTQKDYNEVLKLAESLGDNSLKYCVGRLTNYPRYSLDHYVEIGYDFAKHSFGFAIMMDGQCTMNGGIVYTQERPENKWQIHT